MVVLVVIPFVRSKMFSVEDISRSREFPEFDVFLV